jgi:hypothetical protein
MKKIIYKSLLLSLVLSLVCTSCLKDLDREPFFEQTSASVYKDPQNYIHVLAKIYGGLSLTGQKGPAGTPDISTDIIDEGTSNYLRTFWNLQELPTDEVKCRWGDPGIPDLCKWTWSPNNTIIKGSFLRFLYQVTMCNEFIKESSDDKMTERGFSTADQDLIRQYRLEARFIKSLALFHALDLFGNIPDITNENDYPGTKFPDKQFDRASLFAYIESELLDVESSIAVKENVGYARANKECVQTLLAKLYLNAKAFTGTDRYADALIYCKKVIDANKYSIEGSYTNLFRADNDLSNEVIFPIPNDGTRTQNYGGTTFLINASGFATDTSKTAPTTGEYTKYGTAYPSLKILDTLGLNGQWSGLLATNEMFTQFPDSNQDSRYQIMKTGRIIDFSVLTNSGDNKGYLVKKFRNITKAGAAGSSTSFADTDFPLFRLADVYLMYAEAQLRGGGGSASDALNYVNSLRERAYGNSSKNFTSLSLDDILSERSRELYWEGYRRTDLIRFGKFTGNAYVWVWKGNDLNGTSTADYLSLYPIPASELTANPNLKQNLGY